jgi:hypothetical protein
MRQVVPAGVHQVAMNNRAGASAPSHRNWWRRFGHAAFHVFRSHRPQTVRGAGVEVGLCASPAMTARQQIQTAAQLCRLIEHDHEGGHVRLLDSVELPSAVVLMPRPHAAFDRGFRIDFRVMQIQFWSPSSCCATPSTRGERESARNGADAVAPSVSCSRNIDFGAPVEPSRTVPTASTPHKRSTSCRRSGTSAGVTRSGKTRKPSRSYCSRCVRVSSMLASPFLATVARFV